MPDLFISDDRGNDIPVFIHRELDDLPLTVNEFRVYCHLARRAGQDNDAWPSYNSIGEACFRATYPKAKPETLRQHALKAVKGLVQKGLISKQNVRRDDGSHVSNHYRLTSRSEWGGSSNILGVVAPYQGSMLPLPSSTVPKGTPIEVSTNEGSPLKGTKRAKPVSQAKSEAVLLFREFAKRWPSKPQQEWIDLHVTDTERWRAALTEWFLRGYSPVNVKGMVEFYQQPTDYTKKKSARAYGPDEDGFWPDKNAHVFEEIARERRNGRVE